MLPLSSTDHYAVSTALCQCCQGLQTRGLYCVLRSCIASGVCKVPLNIQSYSGIVECYVLPMNTDFDLILGDRRCTKNGADAIYTEHCLRIKHSDSDGTVHRLQVHSKPIERTEFLCSLVDKSEVADAMRKGDGVFFVNVTSIHDNDYVRCNSLQVKSADASTVIDSLPQDMQSVVKEHIDVFPDKLPNGLPPTRSVFHTIDLKPGSTPPPRRVYRLSQGELKEVNRQVSDLLEKGYIQPSASPCGAGVLFVAKKSGELRMCVDSRALNKQTVKNSYPLPRIDDLYDKLAGSTVFTTLDMQSAYYQVRLHPEDVPKTAFTTPLGLYEFKVLCFGLTNAPATFQSLMNEVLHEVRHFCLVYLDDILIFSRNAEEHVEHVRQVLQLLRKHKLYAKLSKCSFAQPEVHFLGHVVSAQGSRVDPKKVEIVKNWPVPNDCLRAEIIHWLCKLPQRLHTRICKPVSSS